MHVFREFHCSQIEIVESFQITNIILAIIREFGGDKLMNSQLINVENEFAHDLIGTGKDLLDYSIMLTTEWHDALKNVFSSSMICCLVIDGR
jgi:hypothetical protein